jgi:hypothetical protein
MSTPISERSPSGWTQFAAVTLFAVGFYRVISAIAYFANSHKVNDLTGGLFSSHLWAWGLWDLLIAAAALYGGYSLLAGGTFGRIVAYIWGILVIVQGLTIIGIAPWFGVTSIAIAALVLYAVSSTPAEEHA